MEQMAGNCRLTPSTAHYVLYLETNLRSLCPVCMTGPRMPELTPAYRSLPCPMTPEHLFFIPSIFLLGVFVGAFVVRSNERASAKHASDTLPANGVPAAALAPGKGASARALVVAFLVFVGVFVGTHLSPALGGVKALSTTLSGQKTFDQRPAADATEVHERLAAMGEFGRAAYQRFTHTADVLFPLSLLAFLLLLSRFVLGRRALPTAIRRALMALPFLWFGLDMLENGLVYTLIAQFPADDLWLAAVLGWVTRAKFVVLLASLAAPTLLFLTRRAGGSIVPESSLRVSSENGCPK